MDNTNRRDFLKLAGIGGGVVFASGLMGRTASAEARPWARQEDFFLQLSADPPCSSPHPLAKIAQEGAGGSANSSHTGGGLANSSHWAGTGESANSSHAGGTGRSANSSHCAAAFTPSEAAGCSGGAPSAKSQLRLRQAEPRSNGIRHFQNDKVPTNAVRAVRAVRTQGKTGTCEIGGEPSCRPLPSEWGVERPECRQAGICFRMSRHPSRSRITAPSPGCHAAGSIGRQRDAQRASISAWDSCLSDSTDSTDSICRDFPLLPWPPTPTASLLPF